MILLDNSPTYSISSVYAPAKSMKKPTAKVIFLSLGIKSAKTGKLSTKKIPIPTQAQELIDCDKPLTADLHRLKINDIMKELLADKTAYCLRHTFATVCQHYVRPDIVDIWMGDSPDRLVGKVYTHFPDKFRRIQIDKSLKNKGKKTDFIRQIIRQPMLKP